jgi:hypothetical protein
VETGPEDEAPSDDEVPKKNDERTKLELLRPFIEAVAELIVDDILKRNPE